MAKREEPKAEDNTEELYEKAYHELSQQAPAREVEAPVVQTDKNSQTLGEAIGLAEDLTDLQYAMSKLFPATLDNNATMIGRIDPNALLSILHLMSINEIMRTDSESVVDVNSVYLRNYNRLTIGLDGRGRIDIAELLGAVREQKNAEKMLGAGGI